MISKDKLSQYDLQILNMVALATGTWYLSDAGMGHHKFGDFTKSLYGLGLQATSTNRGTSNYRRLSWRGQMLLRKEWRRMLAMPISDRDDTVCQQEQASSSLSLAAIGGGFAQGGMVASSGMGGNIAAGGFDTNLYRHMIMQQRPTITEILREAGEERLQQQANMMQSNMLYSLSANAMQPSVVKTDPAG